MIISLIGMSGTGKSHWSKQLEKKGFKRFCVDDLIEEKLGDELTRLGFSGINDVSKWMGQPYDKQYARTSKKYLDFENEIMKDVLSEIKKMGKNGENFIIDTTGSVIYTDIEILNTMSNLSQIVYLETPQTVQKEMYELYIDDPKPVIWGDSFSIKKGESSLDALKRCYPELLAYRTKKYKELADVSLDYYTLRDPQFTVEKFLQQIPK